jgi:hypothetical protein
MDMSFMDDLKYLLEVLAQSLFVFLRLSMAFDLLEIPLWLASFTTNDIKYVISRPW